MKKPRKKLIIFLVIFLICAGILTFFAIYYRPMPLAISSEATVIWIEHSTWVERPTREGSARVAYSVRGDVSELVDLEQVIEILSQFTFVRIPYDQGRIFARDIQWSIGFWRRPSDFVSITLGYNNFMRRNNTSFRIHNDELLLRQLNALFEF